MSSLHFLNLKGFHPNNKANQKRKWIAEEKEKDKKKREAESLREYEQEQQHFEHVLELEQQHQLQQHVEKIEDKSVEGKKKRKRRKKANASNESTVIQEEEEEEQTEIVEQQGMVEPVTKKLKNEKSLQFMYMPPPGLKSALEKQEKEAKQDDKFSFLKNAPTEGKYTENVQVKHKPFGIELRQVRCMRCGNYGHVSGDRECPLKDCNPMDMLRQSKEDPMHTYIKDDTNSSNNSVQNKEQREYLQKPLLMEPLKEYKFKSMLVKDTSENNTSNEQETMLSQQYNDYVELEKLFNNLNREDNQIIVNKLDKKDLKRLRKRYDKLCKVFAK